MVNNPLYGGVKQGASAKPGRAMEKGGEGSCPIFPQAAKELPRSLSFPRASMDRSLHRITSTDRSHRIASIRRPHQLIAASSRRIY